MRQLPSQLALSWPDLSTQLTTWTLLPPTPAANALAPDTWPEPLSPIHDRKPEDVRNPTLHPRWETSRLDQKIRTLRQKRQLASSTNKARDFKHAYDEALLKRRTPPTASTTPMPIASTHPIPLLALSPKKNMASSFKQAYDQARMRKFELARERAQSARPTPVLAPEFASASPMKVPSLLALEMTKPSCLVEGLAL